MLAFQAGPLSSEGQKNQKRWFLKKRDRRKTLQVFLDRVGWLQNQSEASVKTSRKPSIDHCLVPKKPELVRKKLYHKKNLELPSKKAQKTHAIRVFSPLLPNQPTHRALEEFCHKRTTSAASTAAPEGPEVPPWGGRGSGAGFGGFCVFFKTKYLI